MILKFKQFAEERKWLLIYSLCSIAFLYLVFAPAINFLYYGGDDYRYTFGNPGLSCSKDDGYHFMMTLGRPLQAYMDCLSFRYAFTVERMRDIRLIAVLLMGCSVGLIADWLRMYGVSLLQGFLIAAALVLIPHFYGDTILTGALSLPVPILLAIIAYRCVLKSHTAINTARLLRAIAVILLIIAMLSYPAMSFFYCTFMLTKVLFSRPDDWSKTKREVIIETKIFLFAGVIFFAWAYYNMHFHSSASVPPEYRLDRPNINPIEMISRLFIIANVFGSLWSILPLSNNITQGNVILFFLTGGLTAGALTYFYKHKKAAISQLVQPTVFAGALFLLCCAFALVIPSYNTGARLFMGSVSAGIIIVIWAVYRCGSVLPVAIRSTAISAVLVSYLVLQGYQANLHMMRAAWHFVGYLHQSEAVIQNWLTDQHELKRIHFITEKGEYAFNRYFLASGALSQALGHDKYNIKWCGAANTGPTEDSELQKKSMACLKSLQPGVIGITYSQRGESYPPSDATVVIDKQFEEVKVNGLIAL